MDFHQIHSKFHCSSHINLSSTGLDTIVMASRAQTTPPPKIWDHHTQLTRQRYVKQTLKSFCWLFQFLISVCKSRIWSISGHAVQHGDLIDKADQYLKHVSWDCQFDELLSSLTQDFCLSTSSPPQCVVDVLRKVFVDIPLMNLFASFTNVLSIYEFITECKVKWIWLFLCVCKESGSKPGMDLSPSESIPFNDFWQ